MKQKEPKLIGYARVSMRHQNLGRQIDALEAYGCDLIFTEAVSGKSTKNRPELMKALAALRKGSVFVVAEWDRATRSMADGFDIIAKVQASGAGLRVLDRASLDLTTPSGRAILGVLSAFCQEERERIVERCTVGIRRYVKNGGRMGPKPKLDEEQQAAAMEMLGRGMSERKVAREFDVSGPTINRLKKAAHG